MSTFDVRVKIEKIDVIRFADDEGDGSGSTAICEGATGTILFSSEFLKPENLDNFIKALEKTKELGWGQ